MDPALFPSRYNFAVAGDDGSIVLYSAFSGSLITLSGTGAAALAQLLLVPSREFEPDCVDSETLARLMRGAFLTARHEEQVAAVRERFDRARDGSPPILTITTTMECNLGCYYCYEERSGKSLKAQDIDQVLSLAERMIGESPRPSLHVDWYGGEPLLNLEFMEAASARLIALTESAGARYTASIISNGTEWPADVRGFIARNRVTQVQISFDGLKKNHDKRRFFLAPYRRGDRSSFDLAAKLVDTLVSCVRVDLRFNIDRGNAGDLPGFIDFACERGWFSARFPAVFQPARLSAYSERSRFMASSQLGIDEFDRLRADIRKRLSGIGKVEESEIPDGYPRPRTSVCAALARHSHVVGGEGHLYRCGLQVGESDRAVGAIHDGEVVADHDSQWWEGFDPTRAETCSVCSFLPICWGGCPKKHLERDRAALDEQGAYWRRNLPRLIAQRAGMMPPDVEVPLEQQFRG